MCEMITQEIVDKLVQFGCGMNDSFMLMAILMATHSHCVKKHVGAVIVRNDRIISTGYNGAPSGFPHCDETYVDERDGGKTKLLYPNGCKRAVDNSCSLSIHAEANALMFALRNGVNVKGSRIFVTMSPCLACARMLFQADITEVVYLESYADWKGYPSDDALKFLSDCNMKVNQHEFISDLI
jgi:dCMP deaminase